MRYGCSGLAAIVGAGAIASGALASGATSARAPAATARVTVAQNASNPPIPSPEAVPSPAVRSPEPAHPSSSPVVSPGPGRQPDSSSSSTLPTPAPNPAREPGASPSPEPSAAGRFHLHRPGTDVDGDLLTGNAASRIYVLKGNVTLQSDPKIDRAVAAASESTLPLTVTADEVDVDRDGLTYTAKGHVRFRQGTRSGRADLAMLDESRQTLDLIGNATVSDSDRRTAADKLHYDMLGKTYVGAGNVRIYEPLPTPNPNAAATPPPKRKRRIPL